MFMSLSTLLIRTGFFSCSLVISMDIRTFSKRFMIWTAIIVAVAIAVIGLCFGKVVEGSLAEEIGKWIVMGIFIVGAFEVFVYILAPFFYHMKYDKKK